MVQIEFLGGRACPRLLCDACGEPITHFQQGLAQLFRDGTVRFVHKDFVRPGCDGRNGDAGWMELAHFLVYLESNLGIDQRAHAKARNDALLFASL